MDEYYNWQTKLTTFKGFVDNFQKGIVQDFYDGIFEFDISIK